MPKRRENTVAAEEQQAQRLLEAEEVLNEQGEDFIRYEVSA